MISSCEASSVLSSALPLTVATLALLIAFRQWRTAHNKLKLDLFERRMAVYRATRAVLREVTQTGTISDKSLFLFREEITVAPWIFNIHFARYLEKRIYEVADRLQNADAFSELPTLDKEHWLKQKIEIKEHILAEYNTIEKRFGKFMSIA